MNTDPLRDAIAQGIASSFFLIMGGTEDMPQPEPQAGDYQIAYDLLAGPLAPYLAVVEAAQAWSACTLNWPTVKRLCADLDAAVATLSPEGPKR